MRLALYEPDIPQNTGTIMRSCACFGVPLDIIEPCGFLLTDKNLKRAGMDYLESLDMTRHASFDKFKNAHAGKRLVLMTTKSSQSIYDFTFKPDDIILMGRESSGVPDDIHTACESRIRIPMAPNARSLNVAVSASIALYEALRHIKP